MLTHCESAFINFCNINGNATHRQQQHTHSKSINIICLMFVYHKFSIQCKYIRGGGRIMIPIYFIAEWFSNVLSGSTYTKFRIDVSAKMLKYQGVMGYLFEKPSPDRFDVIIIIHICHTDLIC